MKKLKMAVFLVLLLGITCVSFSMQARADEVKTKKLYTLETPTWLSKAGLDKGIGHDKQDLGIILPANVELEIRQVNPKFTGSLTMALFNDDSQKEKNATITSSWTKVSHAYTAVPLIETTFTSEAPIVEYKVTDKMKALPDFMLGNDDGTLFLEKWDSNDAEFAMLKTRYFQMLVPKKDKAYMKNMKDFKTVEELCNYYNKVFEIYNELAGLSFTPTNATDKNVENRYFIKANAHGPGGGYYGKPHTGQSNDTLAVFFLMKGWGGIHEIGHGYQGAFMSDPSFGVAEVWNNLYAATFERRVLGSELYAKGTMYGDSRAGREANLNRDWKINKLPMNNWGGSSKERILMNFQEKAGDKALTVFNQEYRKIANEDGFAPANHYLLDLISKYYGQASGFDFTPVIESGEGVMSREQKEENRLNNYQAVAALVDVVPAAKVSEVQAELGLESYLTLVDTTQLEHTGLFGSASIHLDIDDFSQIKGQYLTVKNGKEVVKKVLITDKDIELGILPNGIYTIDAPTGNSAKYALDNYYLYVKDTTNKCTIKYTPKTASYLASQTIRFQGLGDHVFSSAKVDLEQGKLFVNTSATSPHSYFGSTLYAKIEVLDTDGKVVYTKSMTGTNTVVDKADVAIKVGYKLRIYHAEPERLRADDKSERLVVGDTKIVDTAQKTNIFTITSTGLANDSLKNNPDDILIVKIKEAVAKVEANPLLLNAPNSEVKDDIWIAIQLLSEPAKSQMLEKYSNLFPALAAMEEPLTSVSITAPDTLNLKKDGFSGKYGEDIAAVKLIVEGRVVQVATLNPATHTYTFSGLTGKRIRTTDGVSVIGYTASGSEVHQLEMEVTN
ncbi:putative mucin/carbohydrate-binding domain-containing protein [Listeria rustica]|uniref:Enhancing factor n=1 Tax=Listeria rustica TaxID=2713503 RepID=A0A7W1YHL9_9LIST|nr:putative mucin/carbohydrate-binding domain-containing protein [Listeria rustica]MBA3927826.1 enhancing factor [Listeria rustica]